MTITKLFTIYLLSNNLLPLLQMAIHSYLIVTLNQNPVPLSKFQITLYTYYSEIKNA